MTHFKSAVDVEITLKKEQYNKEINVQLEFEGKHWPKLKKGRGKKFFFNSLLFTKGLSEMYII